MKFVLKPTPMTIFKHIANKVIDALKILLPSPFIHLYVGFDFTDDLIVDPRNLEWMREANCPIVST